MLPGMHGLGNNCQGSDDGLDEDDEEGENSDDDESDGSEGVGDGAASEGAIADEQ